MADAATLPLLAVEARRPPQHLKVVLLGPPASGKTRLFRTRLPAAAATPADPTAAPDFCLFMQPLAGRQQRVQLWDTPGEAAQLPATLALLAGAHAAALVFDASSSAGALARWLPAAAAACAKQSCPLLLVGTGAAPSGRAGEGRALAAARGLAYLELSAAASQAETEALFAALGEAALRAHQQRPPSQGRASSASGPGASAAGCPCCSTQ
jgi:hypothetical protein